MIESHGNGENTQARVESSESAGQDDGVSTSPMNDGISCDNVNKVPSFLSGESCEVLVPSNLGGEGHRRVTDTETEPKRRSLSADITISAAAGILKTQAKQTKEGQRRVTDTETEPKRRSLSVDITISAAAGILKTRAKQTKSLNSKVAARQDGECSKVRKAVKFSSFGQSQQKGPVSMNRSASSGGKVWPSGQPRNQNPANSF
ncbi:hypothetical protein BT93_H3392 [Corymbia citriodora subsp. variegata]|nr:hypothetical protein BT93_H3392 [Corymbia citriodora subsp. variegata]